MTVDLHTHLQDKSLGIEGSDTVQEDLRWFSIIEMHEQIHLADIVQGSTLGNTLTRPFTRSPG
jgi:hypothetical protein